MALAAKTAELLEISQQLTDEQVRKNKDGVPADG